MISITLLRELSAFEAIELWYLEKQPTWKPRELSGGIRKGAKYGRSRPAEVEGSGDGGNGRMGNLPSPHSLRRYGGGGVGPMHEATIARNLRTYKQRQ